MNAEHLLTHFDRIADAPDAMPRLRRFILDLAVRGKLVEQDPNDEPAAELLKRIAAEKARLVKVGEIKKQSALPLVAACEAQFSIPNVWEWTRIGSAAYVEMGQSPPSEHYNRTGQGIPFFQGKADFGKRYPTARYWCTQPKKYAVPDDILISVRAPVGPTNIASELCCIGRGLAALRPYKGIDRDYLLRCLEAFELVLAVLGFGTTFVAINKNQLASFVIPLPPLAEQHRIVAKVDELMALCGRLETARKERETTRNRLAAVSLARLNAPDPDPAVFWNHAAFTLTNLASLTTRPDQIKALRQTILNLAVRGKLVEQDPEDEPASELLKRIATEKVKLAKRRKLRAQKPLPPISDSDVSLEIPTSWKWARLGDVIKLWSGFAFKSEDFQSQGIPVIRIGDLRAGKVDLSNTVCVSEDVANSVEQGFWIPPQALLIAMSGATTGKVAFNKSSKKLLLNQRVGRIETFLININFVRFFFDTIVARNLEISFGTAIPNLSAKQINETVIPLPPLAEQHRIVAKVDKLIALCDRLEASLVAGDKTQGRLVEALLHETLTPSRPAI